MAVDEAVHESIHQRGDLPSFKLSYTLDYDDNPTRVIIYDEPEGSSLTNWISINIEYAIDLGEIA